MRQMIAQEDGMGCGAACVAFVANQSYQQAVTIMGAHKAKTVGFQLKELVSALERYGFKYQIKHVRPEVKQVIYQECAVVFVKRSSHFFRYGHYLIRHNGLWGDPWINHHYSDKTAQNAKSAYRQRLPGKAQWVLLPIKDSVDDSPQ